MRAKLEFTDIIDNFIKECYKSHKTQDQIRQLLLENYNFKVGKQALSLRYKKLGINGNYKLMRQELKPWHKLFTNSAFPNPIANCILYDLFINYKIEDIAKKRHTTVAILKSHLLGYDITPQLRKQFGAYRKIYQWNNKTDLRNYDEHDNLYILNKVNAHFKGKAHLKINHSINVLNKKFTFDLYCKEANNLLITCPGNLYAFNENLYTVGYNIFQIDYPRNGETYNNDYVVNVIISRIENEFNGCVPKRERPKDYIAPTDEEIDEFEIKCLEERLHKPFNQILIDKLVSDLDELKNTDTGKI